QLLGVLVAVARRPVGHRPERARPRRDPLARRAVAQRLQVVRLLGIAGALEREAALLRRRGRRLGLDAARLREVAEALQRLVAGLGHELTVYSSASLSVLSFGAGKPGSRPHH